MTMSIDHPSLRFLPAPLAVVILLAGCGSPDVYEAEYLLIDHTGTAIAEGSEPLRVPSYELGYDRRRVLSQHPPSVVRFPEVPAGSGARLLTAPAMNPAAWEKPTDGVRFSAFCRGSDGDLVPLLEIDVSPAVNPEDRIWHDCEAPLDGCSAPRTEIELRTSCGERGNCAADWAGWGDPRVVYESTFEPRPRRLALLISIDTLRPDRLGLYGASRQTSPELERLAADGIVFETAVAAAPWTIPSHATLLSSTWPQVHAANARAPIAESVALLPGILRAAGWQTAGFVDTAYLGSKFGFDRGFDHFDDEAPPPGDYRRGARVLRQRLLSWLASADERPAFVFWHLMDVHGPYSASAPFGGAFRQSVASQRPGPRLEQLRRLAYHDYLRLDRFSSFDDLVATYDEGVAVADAVVGGLLQVLRDAGLYDEALIVVTSDHGESFLDHGVWVGHGLFLTDDELRVPLVVKLPGNRHAGARVREMVGLIDVAPSILDALGVAAAGSFQGRSLLSPAPGDPASLPEVVYGFSSNIGAPFLRTRQYKYIGPAGMTVEKILAVHLKARENALQTSLPVDEQLYHLRRDPGESSSLAAAQGPAKLAPLRALLVRYEAEARARREGAPAAVTPELSVQEREQLRALGYVD